MRFRSLRTKLIAVLLLLLSILAAATAFATLSAMKQDGKAQASQSLAVAGKVLLEALDNRAEQLSTTVQILAADFGFRRAVATAEAEGRNVAEAGGRDVRCRVRRGDGGRRARRGGGSRDLPPSSSLPATRPLQAPRR